MSKMVLNRIQQMMAKNKHLAMVWIEQEFGNYENYLKALNKNDVVLNALNNKHIANHTNKMLQQIF